MRLFISVSRMWWNEGLLTFTHGRGKKGWCWPFLYQFTDIMWLERTSNLSWRGYQAIYIYIYIYIYTHTHIHTYIYLSATYLSPNPTHLGARRYMRNARIYMRNPEFPWASIAKQIKSGVGSERTFTWVLESSGLWTQGEQALPWPLSVGSWGNVASFYNFRSLVKKCPFSLFKKIIYFNWRILYLQYCGGFCHTLTWITHGYTCVSPSWTPLWPPSPSHPSG